MEFIFRNTIIETTPAKNAEYYNNIPIISDECSCDKCHNFVNGVGKLVPEISDFFAKIGIDIKKPESLSALYSEDNGHSICYWAFYELYGSIIEDSNDQYSITWNCHVSFHKKNSDVIQAEVFFHHFPWILGTPICDLPKQPQISQTGYIISGDMKDFYFKALFDEDSGGYFILYSKNFDDKNAEGYDEWYPDIETVNSRLTDMEIEWND